MNAIQINISEYKIITEDDIYKRSQLIFETVSQSKYSNMHKNKKKNYVEVIKDYNQKKGYSSIREMRDDLGSFDYYAINNNRYYGYYSFKTKKYCEI